MPCFAPQLAQPMPGKTQSGKTPYRFIGKASEWYSRSKKAPLGCLLLPCRQCIGCRLEKSRQWATRLLHEKKYHPGSVFLTLTYDEDHVPKDGTLNKTDLQSFWKKLRFRNSDYGKAKIKYFACGEYGDQTGRPHYHAALYGSLSVPGPSVSDSLLDQCDPRGFLATDPELIQEEYSRSGAPQWSHPDISACWKHGRHRLSDLSFESAAYMARYILKKISGASAPNHYGARIPEFQTSSNGLGKTHVLGDPDRLIRGELSDIYPADHIVLPGRGNFMPPPYYDRLLEKADPALFQQVKQARKDAHEKMTHSEWYENRSRRDREGRVRQIVTDQTLIRGLI